MTPVSYSAADEHVGICFPCESNVNLEIYRLGDPAMMCAAILIPYRETIMLDGNFEPGKYTITVNDYELEVEI